MNNSYQKFTKSFQTSLALYAFALSTIVALVTTSFFVERKMMKSQNKFATIINVSGKQRMLSQRIAAFAHRSTLSNDSYEVEEYKKEIRSNLAELRKSFLLLNSDGLLELNNQELITLHKNERDKILEFFDFVDRFANLEMSSELSGKIFQKASGPVLKYYETETLLREKRAQEILNEYLTIKSFLYMCTVILILAEGLLMFYPLAKRNLANHKEILHLYEEEEKLKKFSELGESLSRMVHEINNPLTVIMMKAKNLMNSDCSDEVKATLDVILKNLDRVTKIIKSTKSIYRKSNNDPLTEVSIKKIALEALDASRLLRDSKDIIYDTENLNDLSIQGREHQLFQVYLNLIVNAIDSLNNSNVSSKKITITAHTENKTGVTRIFDNGPGIPDGSDEKVFQSLYTTKINGTGMGLAECRRLVELDQGSIRINRKIHDSCFEIIYPLA